MLMPRITKKALDLKGKVFGKLEVIDRDLDSLGRRDSWWLVRCLDCGKEYSATAYRIKSNKGGCKKCAIKNRTYARLTTSCQVCGQPVDTESRHPDRYCSKKCRTDASVARAMANRRASVEGTVRQLTTSARSRAKKKGLPCDIDIPYMLDLLSKQKGLCAKTGRVLEASIQDNRGLRGTSPNVVSIDRIDSNAGYVKGNVQLVSYMYNTAKNKFGEKDLLELCIDVLTKAGYTVSERRAEVHG
jgi:hypothetical protein